MFIIDELGYVALDPEASNLFFQVISARHDAELGTIATTNLPFGQFNQIFATMPLPTPPLIGSSMKLRCFTWRVIAIGRIKDKKN